MQALRDERDALKLPETDEMRDAFEYASLMIGRDLSMPERITALFVMEWLTQKRFDE